MIQRRDIIAAELNKHKQEKEYLSDVISELELLELEDDDELDLDEDDGLSDANAEDTENAKNTKNSKSDNSKEYKDNDKKVQYKIGDTLVFMSYTEANERAQNDSEKADLLISELESKLEDIDAQLQKLKTQLYAKFGDNINLERD